jgi:hypothetical protein
MTRRLMLFAVLAILCAGGRATSGEAAPPKEVRDPTQVFTERIMVVKGEGTAPTDRPLSGNQKRMLALRAAKVVALRELTEVLQGVRVTGETCVEDMAVKSDQIKAAVAGTVRGAEVVYESYDEKTEVGTAYVQVSLDGPNGLSRTLLPSLIEAKALPLPAAKPFAPAAQPAAAPEPADALIIDATGKPFRPALVNRIVVANGSVLFEPSKVAPEILAKRGCGDYTSDLGKAKAILASHGAKNPMVVKVAGVERATDAQVSEVDAATIFAADQKTSFLEGAQVVFVL